MARGLEEVAALPDPVGRVLATFKRPNGLVIDRVATPLGVIGVIYESRPNVTADAGALCLKAGNAAVLRGGSDSFHSSAAIHACLVAGLEAAGLPEAAISRVPFASREAVGEMLEGLGGALDVIVPRGGRSLVERVQREARVPVFAHLEGIVHVYVDRAADLDKAKRMLVNSKMRRTGVCGAAETLLIDRAAAPRAAAAADRGADRSRLRNPRRRRDARRRRRADAGERSGLAHGISRRDHRRARGRRPRRRDRPHRDLRLASHRLHRHRGQSGGRDDSSSEVDWAIVLVNASTQFADGGEFGFGARDRHRHRQLHARGPVGVEQLCTFKYRVRGDGQTRA